MSDNPYEPPQTTAGPAQLANDQRELLRSVALSQKAIMVCILLHILMIVGRLSGLQERFYVVGVGMVGVATVIFLIQLATRFYGERRGIFLGLLGFLPVIGLVALLVVNRKATKLLQSHGVRVGLMGADLRQLSTEEP